MATEKPRVEVKFDRVYGNIVCYPANPVAENICRLTRKKTLSPQDLEVAKALGFGIQLSPESIKVLQEFLTPKVPA